MEVRIDDETAARLETDPEYSAGYDPATVKGFRKVMQFIRNAQDQRDFAGMRSMRFEKLRGQRSHQYSLRLTKKWRLIIELEKAGKSQVVLVKGIQDYH
jgi:proteic killer suppression protein